MNQLLTKLATEMGLPLDKVQSIMKMAQQPISLQSPVGDSDDTNFGDFIEDKGAENPYDMTAYSLLREKISMFWILLPREKEMCCLFDLVSRMVTAERSKKLVDNLKSLVSVFVKSRQKPS